MALDSILTGASDFTYDPMSQEDADLGAAMQQVNILSGVGPVSSGETTLNGAPAANNSGNYGDVLSSLTGTLSSLTGAASNISNAVLNWQTQADQRTIALNQSKTAATVDTLRAQASVLQAQAMLNPLGISYNGWMLILAAAGVYFAAKAVKK